MVRSGILTLKEQISCRESILLGLSGKVLLPKSEELWEKRCEKWSEKEIHFQIGMETFDIKPFYRGTACIILLRIGTSSINDHRVRVTILEENLKSVTDFRLLQSMTQQKWVIQTLAIIVTENI